MRLPVHRLESGTFLLSDGFLPSDEGYTHRIDTVHDIGGGWTRVFIDVLNAIGAPRCRYDKLFSDDYEEIEVDA